MHIGKAKQVEEITAPNSNIVTPQILHTNFEMKFISLHFITHKTLHGKSPFTSLPFTSLHFNFITVLDNFSTPTFSSVHHINHFPRTISKSIWFTGESA